MRPWKHFRVVLLAGALAFGASLSAPAAVDTSYAVQATATVQISPAQVTLSWTQAPAPATGYAISRKDDGAGGWTPLMNVGGTTTTYTDTNVTAGRVYEYQIVRQAPGITGYGYLASAIDLPVIESRGRVILVVDNSIAGAISSQLDQFNRDLVGDGWTVARRDIGRTDPPSSVREAIRAAYNESPSTTRAVILIGHVPVARSGNINIDGHGARPMPADAYYGDMDGTWTDANGDGVFDHDQIPSDVELMVGRIDFADLPGARGPALPGETDLLRRYFQKDHDYRHAVRRVPARALIGDRVGDSGGEAFGTDAFRAFPALLGAGATTVANVEDSATVAERWLAKLTSQDWLWVFGGGGGDVGAISSLGAHGLYSDVWSEDLVAQNARGTFYLFFGSHLMEWNRSDSLLRAALATSSNGLASTWTGRPHLFFQHLAVGEPIGYGLRLSQNNRTLYTNQQNLFTRAVHVALMGDPTLRLNVIAPPGNVSVGGGGGAPALTWGASADADAGYHVYRAASDAGPFTRLTTSPVSGMTYTDTSAGTGTYTYQVRAVHRQVTGSASYFNQSQAVFATATVSTPSGQPTNTSTSGTSNGGTTTPTTGDTSTPTTSGSGTSGGASTPTPVGSGTSGGSSTGGGGGGAPSTLFVAALALLMLARKRFGCVSGR